MGPVWALAAVTPNAGIYQEYRPAPTHTVPPQGKVARLHRPAWELIMKGGLALPMGDNAAYNQSGFGGGAELLYEASPELGASLFVQALNLRYKVEGAGSPFTALGTGLKARINLGEFEDVRPYMGAGLGLFHTNRAALKFIGIDPIKNIAMYEVEYKSSNDIGFVASLGGAYRFHPQLDFLVEFNITSVGLAGGTSETAMSLGLHSGLGWRF